PATAFVERLTGWSAATRSKNAGSGLRGLALLGRGLLRGRLLGPALLVPVAATLLGRGQTRFQRGHEVDDGGRLGGLRLGHDLLAGRLLVDELEHPLAVVVV